MIELSWTIHGHETLGISEVLNNHFNGIGPPEIPITPMMAVHLDQIVIQYYLEPLAKNLLDELQKSFYEHKAPSFEIFLTQYILATHFEWLLRHARYNAAKYNIPRRYNSMKQAKQFIRGHNILMTHFHYFTASSSNKVGNSPEGCRLFQGLTKDQSLFIEYVRADMSTPDVKRLRNMKRYEQNWYFAHQIFDGLDWDPESEEVADLTMGC